MMFFNEFLFNDCIIENIKTFITFNETFVINDLFLKLFAQTTRRRRLSDINLLYLLIFCLKIFYQKFYNFFWFFIKIIKNVIDNFFRNNNLHVD